MGRCQEFGLQIRDGCGHAMVAGKTSCSCAECQVVCGGRFAGCPDVWARGAQPGTLTLNREAQVPPALSRTATNGAAEATRSPMARAQPGHLPPATMAAGSPKTTTTEETVAMAPENASMAPENGAPADPAPRDRWPADGPSDGSPSGDPETPGTVPDASVPDASVPDASVPEGPAASAVPTPVSAAGEATPDDAPDDHPPSTSPQPESATTTALRSPTSQAPASAAALRWLEGAFAGLRAELESLRGHLHQQQATMVELVNGITQQQVLLSELLDARDSDFRLAEAAEALPQFVSDAVAHEVRVSRERTVAAIASTLDAKLAEANLGAGLQAPPSEDTVAHLRSVLEHDPATSSIVAAISTEAATRAMREEVAEQLPVALDGALARSDARLDELAERMEKMVTRALRAGSASVPGDLPARASRRPVAKTRAASGAASPLRPTPKPKAVATRAAKAIKPTRSAAAAKARPNKTTASSATKRSATKRAATTTVPAGTPATRTTRSTATKARSAGTVAKRRSPSAGKRSALKN